MSAPIEFQIDGTLCRVVPADSEGGARSWGDAAAADAAPLRVIGNCSLGGRRYVVLGAIAEPAPPGANVPLSQVLSRRELEIALMVCDGEGNKQIADRLRLSEWTVSSYLRRTYAKLGVHCRAAMVARILAATRP